MLKPWGAEQLSPVRGAPALQPLAGFPASDTCLRYSDPYPVDLASDIGRAAGVISGGVRRLRVVL